MKEMINVEDTESHRVFAKSLLTSMDRYHGAVVGNYLDRTMMEKVGGLIVRLEQLRMMVSLAESELKVKMEGYE